MANDYQDWSSIFQEDDDSQAISDPAQNYPSQEDDWSSIFSGPAIQEDEPGWGFMGGSGTGWDTFEPSKSLKEVAAATGRMIHTTMKTPKRVLTDITSRITGLPSFADMQVDWDKVPQNKIKDIQKLQNINELVEKFGTISSPGEAILSMLKISGALEPDVEYQLRKQGKALEVQVAEDFIGTAPQMAMNMFAGLAAGPAGAIASSGMQVYGAAYERHSEKNKPLEAAILALVDAIPQTVIESISTIFLLGGLKAFKPIMNNKVMSKLAKSLDKKPVNWLISKLETTIVRIAGSIAGEGAEEYAQSIVEMGSDIIQMKMDGKEITGPALKELLAEKHKEGKYSAIVGALWGLAAGGPMAIMDRHNPLKDANPTETPEVVKGKEDAREIVEKAFKEAFMVEEPGEETEVVDVHPDVDLTDIEEGAPGAEVDIDAETMFDLKAEEPLRYRVETVEGDEGADFYGGLKGEQAISITDKESPAFKATIVSKKGEEDITIARKEREFLAGKRDIEGFIDNWMANEKSRPEWADRRAQPAEITTDLGKAWDDSVRRDAVTAYREAIGDDVTVQAEAVHEMKSFLDKKYNYSEPYGEDFLTQKKDSEIDPITMGAKKVIEGFTNVPVFVVGLNEKAEQDIFSEVQKHSGGKTFYSGAIVIIDKADPLQQLGTIFHEKAHEMRTTSPEIFKKAADWLVENGDPEIIKELKERVEAIYKGESKERIAEELVAKFWGDLARQEKYQVTLFKKLKKEDPKLYTKILDYVQGLLRDLRAFINQGFKGEGFTRMIKDLDAAIEFLTDLQIEEIRRGAAGKREGLTIEGSLSRDIGKLAQDITLGNEKQKTFYSKMNKFLFEGKNPKIQGKKLKASNVKDQLIAWAKAGEYKTVELNWSPVLEWLDTQKIVSAKDVEDYIKENHLTVTPKILKLSGMTDDDIKDDLGRLEAARDDITNRYSNVAFTYEENIGSGIDLPKYFALIPARSGAQRLIDQGRRMDATRIYPIEFNSLPDIRKFAQENQDELEISDTDTNSASDLIDSLEHYIAIANGVKKAVGQDFGAAQFGSEEYPSLTTIGHKYDYAEIVMEAEFPKAKILNKRYQTLEKRYRILSDETMKINDDWKAAKGVLSDEKIAEIAKIVVSKTRVKNEISSELLSIGGRLEEIYYESGHYKGPVLGHIRLTDRSVGEKGVLFVEEVQSDWQQRGRKKGFKGEVLKYGSTEIFTPVGFSWKKVTDTNETVTEYGRRMSKTAVIHQLIRDKNGEVVGEGTDKLQALKNANVVQAEMVPDTPFKPFAELALKQIARIAAENGFDYVAWTPASVHIQRYNLAKYVDFLSYETRYSKKKLYGSKENQKIGEWIVDEENTLEDYVGKEVAEKLESQITGRKTLATLELDEDTPVGNFEWAKNLYDKMIPRLANKLFNKKSWGRARVVPLKLDLTEDTASKNVVIRDSEGLEIGDYDFMYDLLENYEGEGWDIIIQDTEERVARLDSDIKKAALNTSTAWLEGEARQGVKYLTSLKRLKSQNATFAIEKLADEELDVLGFPVTEKMKSMVEEGQTLFDIEMDVKDIPVAPAGAGDKAVLNIMSSLSQGTNSIYIDKEDYGTQNIAESLGYIKEGDTYKFDERIPKDADIIAGSYQAAWHIDLESKRSTEKLYSKISKQFGEHKGDGLGKEELDKRKEKLKKYLNKSWLNYRSAADETSKGDFLPTKNLLIRPTGVDNGKGRQLLVQISSDFKSEGASNIGDSYYEALYNKREGYSRPSRDFWELPEWMARMAFFMPDADVYVIRNLKEAKKFFNQAGYDDIFLSVLDITKKPVKEIASSYKGRIMAGGYLPDGSYYKGMKNVTWVEDMPEAAAKLGVKFENGVDYRHFKNTKTIPRLEMSKGCLHKCAFCSQDRFLTITSPEAIDQQIKEYKAFDYEIVYLNDKTFGQAKNYPDLVGIKDKIQKVNPNFKGFVIQTTATQYNKMPDEFLQNAGIVYVELGVETFNDKQLESLSKPHREKHILEAAKKIRRLNQVFVPNVMVGLAGKNKDGSTWVETPATYARTMKFLKANTDIISHTNIGVLAAETGTRLHEQLNAVETDQDEHQMARSWLKNQKIHDRFFEQLSAFGEEQLDSKDVKAYVKNAIKVNTKTSVKSVGVTAEKGSGRWRLPLKTYMDYVNKFSESTVEDIAKDTGLSIYQVENIRDMLEQNKAAPDFDLVEYKEGSRSSETYHKSYFGIFDIARKAKGMGKVRAYLSNQREIYGLPVTPELVKSIGNHADRLAKNKKKYNEFKRLVALRHGIATGELDPRDPKVIKKLEAFEGVMPYTIRHTGDNFFIGEKMRYGKFTDEITLFDEGTDVTRVKDIRFINPVTGIEESLKKYYDKDGNRLIKAPIFSTNRKKRLQEIKAIVKKNSQYLDWYSRWRDFVFQFAKDEKGEIEIKRIAAISGMLGAGKSPQTQQTIWANTIDALTAGRKPRKVSKHDYGKMMDIWEGKYDKVLSKTDDAGIKEIQETFGRKIGPYLAAAVDPSSPNVLVLDRHMPKGWGYNVLHQVGNQQGGWNMHPSVEHEIASDIFQVAKETGHTVAGVQAALWFDFRTPAADISDIVNISQIEPGNYVPYVWHRTTFPEVTTGIHFKKSKLGIGDYVFGATKDGKIRPNTYSMKDIGNRIATSTKDWPYQSVVYMYTPESGKESFVKSGAKAYTFKFDPSEIYDGVKDPYFYWDEARKQHAKSPEANLTNIFLKLVKMREQYNGVLVSNPYNTDDSWILAFEKAIVDDYPELTQVGISDVIESEESTPQEIDEAVVFMNPRGTFFSDFMKKVKGLKKYEELTIDRTLPTLARFGDATSGLLEPGLSVKIDGPLRAQRSYLAEIAVSRGQRQVYLMHEPREDSSYPAWVNYSPGKLFKFKVKDKYNEKPAELVRDLQSAGLIDFNVVESPKTGWLSIEQFVWDVDQIKKTADIIEKFADKGHPRSQVIDVHSEILGHENIEESIGAYRDAIIDYWGNKKGQEVLRDAVKEGERFRGEIRSGAYQKKLADAIKVERAAGKRPQLPESGGLDQDIIVPEGETKEVLDRIGRKDISILDKVTEATDYKKGTFVTGAVDDLNPLKMYAGEKSSAYMLHRGLPGIQSSVNTLLEHGKLILEESGVLTTDTKGKGFLPWLRDLGGDSDKFWYWLIARRDESRQARDDKYKPMFTSDEREKLFKWTGTKSAKGKAWQQVNKEFQEFNQSVLDVGIDSGLLDPAMVRQFKDQFYVPFYRIFENENATAEFIKAPVNTKRIIAAQIKKLRGSRRQMGDPLENILANWSHLLRQSMTNAARKAAFNELVDAKAVSETGELVVEEVPWKDTVIFKSGKDDKTTFVYEKQGIEVLGFKDNGKTRFFKVNDPELFQSLSLLPRLKMPRWLSFILGAPKALLTFGATITPSFVVANTVRDTLHTFTISDHFIPFWDTMRGFVKTLIKDQDFVEYMASGNAFVGSYVKADRPEVFAKFARKIVKKEGQGALGRILDTPRKIFSFWETITEASENAARLALYSNLRKAGKTKLEASFAARDIMDFQKKGASPVVQYLTATVPFLNARIQGLHKMGTAAAANPGMYVLKGGMIAAASLALWAAYKDDERYKELEDWERFAYYHFWIGDHHFRIPKPFETGVIWSSSWTAAADVLSGNDEIDHISSYVGHALLDTFAMNPVPQAAKPILEQYFNKIWFTGRPIETQGMKYKEPGERYYPWDNESAIVLGKAMGVSPRRIQALVRGYLAGLGAGIMGGTDMMVRQFGEFPERPTTDIGSYPMVGRFIKKGPAKYTKYQSKFYDAFDDLNQLYRKIQVARESGEFKEAAEMTRLNSKKLDAFGRAKIVRRNLAQNSKNVKNIWKDKFMTSDVKKKRLDKLAIERNKSVKEFWDWYLENV